MPRRTQNRGTRKRLEPGRRDWNSWLAEVERAARKALDEETAPIFLRACPSCGHFTASVDERLLERELECPSCAMAA